MFFLERFFERELSRIIREFTKIIISFNLRLICGNYTFILRCKYTHYSRFGKGKVLKLCSSDKNIVESFLFSEILCTFEADFHSGEPLAPKEDFQDIVGKTEAFAIIRVQPKA